MTKRSDRGAAAVEFALVLPILLLLVGGVVDFGHAYFTKITLTHAAREGARYLALGTSPSDTVAKVQSAAAGLKSEFVEIPTPVACSEDQPATVTIEYSFSFTLLPMDDRTLSSTGVMKCET